MFKYIIAEDELPARELLRMYMEQMPEFELAGIFDNAVTAFSFLQKNDVDLMFLDIHMPRMTGLDLLRSLKSAPKVIITTAFRDYALEAFELDVIDYLLKPVSQDRFLRSISKFHSYNERVLAGAEKSATYDYAYIFLKVGKEHIKVFLKDILFIEGLKDYIKVHTAERLLVAYDRLGYMEEKLPESHFLRIHKSYIVAVHRISHYNNETVTLNKIELPIGRIYKQAFLKMIASLK